MVETERKARIKRTVLTVSFFCCTGLALIQCSRDRSDDSLANGPPAHFPTEFAPSLSPDRSQIIYAAVDTVVPSNSGIYRAEINLPIRRQLLTVPGISSPTIAPDNNRIAYLVDGKIQYYLVAEDSGYASAVQNQFESIEYIDDSTLIAFAGNSLSRVKEASDSVEVFLSAQYPTIISEDSVLFLRQRTVTVASIELTNLRTRESSILALVEVAMDARGLSLSSNGQWLVYTQLDQGERYVYSVDLKAPTPTHRRLVRCYSDEALIVEENLIVFTGNNGLFFETDYFGSNPTLYGVVKI